MSKSTLASLLVSFDVQDAQLRRGLRAASQDVEAFRKRAEATGKMFAKAFGGIEQASQKVAAATARVGQAGLAIGAVFTAAANAASKYDANIKRVTDTTKGQFAALSVELGRVAVPMLNEFNNRLGGMVRAFRELSPAQKQQISDFATMAVKIGAVLLVTSKVAGIFGSMAGLIKTAFDVVTLHPFLAALIAIAATAGLVVATLHKASQVKKSEAWHKQDQVLQDAWSTSIDQRNTFRRRFEETGGVGMGLNRSTMGEGQFQANLRVFDSDIAQRKAALDKHRGTKPEGTFLDELVSAAGPLGEKFKELIGTIDKVLSGKGGPVDSPVALKDEVGVGFAAKVPARDFTSLAGLAPQPENILTVITHRAKTFAERIGAGLVDLGNGVVASLMDQSGLFGQVLQAAASAGGDPIGTVVNVVGTLLSNSQQMQVLGEMLNGFMQEIANVLGAILEPLMPLVKIATIFWRVLAQLLVPVLKALEPVFRLFYEGVKAIYTTILTIAKAIGDFFGFNTRGLQAGLDELNATTFDNAVPALNGLADAANSATEAILNAPSGFNLNLARQQLGMATVGGGAGGGGGITIEGDLVIEVPEATHGTLAAQIQREIRAGAWRISGNPTGVGG